MTFLFCFGPSGLSSIPACRLMPLGWLNSLTYDVSRMLPSGPDAGQSRGCRTSACSSGSLVGKQVSPEWTVGAAVIDAGSKCIPGRKTEAFPAHTLEGVALSSERECGERITCRLRNPSPKVRTSYQMHLERMHEMQSLIMKFSVRCSFQILSLTGHLLSADSLAVDSLQRPSRILNDSATVR